MESDEETHRSLIDESTSSVLSYGRLDSHVESRI
jgi:hypothetical protein